MNLEAVARKLYERDGEAGLIRDDWDAENSVYRSEYLLAAQEIIDLASSPTQPSGDSE